MNRITIKNSFYILLLLFGLSQTALSAPVTNGAEAVAAAAQQRTLTQAMLKNYVLSGLGVRSRKADKALSKAMTEFSLQQQQLEQFITDSAVRQQLAVQAQSWQQVQSLYQKKPNKDDLLALYAANEKLLSDGNQLLQLMRDANLSQAAPMLDLNGQQQLLCQRLSALYGMMAWGFENQARPAYEQLFDTFTVNLTQLQGMSDNTPLISHNIKGLYRQIQRVETTASASGEKFIPGLVDRSAVKILQKVDELQAEYLILARTLDG